MARLKNIGLKFNDTEFITLKVMAAELDSKSLDLLTVIGTTIRPELKIVVDPTPILDWIKTWDFNAFQIFTLHLIFDGEHEDNFNKFGTTIKRIYESIRILWFSKTNDGS